jgi:hypothetical protein
LFIENFKEFDHIIALAAAGYGVPAGTEPHSRAYLSAKGIRDVASGLFAAIVIAYGSAHPLGWFMFAAAIIPIGDAAIGLRQGGSRAVAFGIHGSTAAAMLPETFFQALCRMRMSSLWGTFCTIGM